MSATVDAITRAAEQALRAEVGLSSTDPVNHPKHYTFGKIEVIDVLEDWQLPYHLACVVKYVARAGKKDPSKEMEDLKKAQWYLNRWIEQRSK